MDDIIKQIVAGIFGLAFGAFCGIVAWVVSQNERGTIRGEAWDKILSILCGFGGMLMGAAAVNDFDWWGIPLAITCALVFFGVAACGGAL